MPRSHRLRLRSVVERDPTKGRFYDRFDLVFAVTIVTVTLLLLVDLSQHVGFSELLAVIVAFLTAATLMLSVAAAGIGRRGFRFAWIVTGMTVAGAIVALFSSIEVDTTGGIFWLILVIAAPYIALKRLVHHRKVTAETVLGAVSVYLLMAVAGTYLFLFIDSFGSGPGTFFSRPEPTTVFMYFSLVTITTLGYGDFSPVEVFGRAAAAWIAITGQIYLVVIVARMVALFGGFTSGERKSDPDHDD